MPDFAYIARDAKGQKVTGTISAANQRDVLGAAFVARAVPDACRYEQANSSGSRSQCFALGKRVKPQIMATFYGQLAGLLRSGVPFDAFA